MFRPALSTGGVRRAAVWRRCSVGVHTARQGTVSISSYSFKEKRNELKRIVYTRQFCDKKQQDGKSNEAFSEMLKKVKNESKKESEESSEKSNPSEKESIDYIRKASDLFGRGKFFWHKITSGWSETWNEMISGPPEEIKKTVGHAYVNTQKKNKDTREGDDDNTKESDEQQEAYTGPQAIVLSDSDKSTWESMQERLKDSPLIQELLRNTRKFKKQAASTDIGQKAAAMGGNVQDKIHDAREFWETSQSPIVYKLSGAWDALTAPTEEGLAISAIQKLDPSFVVESWAEAIKTQRSEVCIRAHLEGNLKVLKPITGEGVYNKLAADIRTRKSDGIKIDTNILQMDELQVLIRMLDEEGPIILCIYMVQQINCIRNRAGEIIEGGESNVIAKYYTIAYKQVYDDEVGVTDWRIVDYHLDNSSDPYY